MSRFRKGGAQSPLRQAEAYWTALRRGDDVPSRSQIDPRGLENILSNTFILERIAPGIARFRLAGSLVNEMAGMEVRGMPVTAFFTTEARKQLSNPPWSICLKRLPSSNWSCKSRPRASARRAKPGCC